MIRLRQVALVANDLAHAEEELTAALEVTCCHRDPELAYFGLHNVLYPIGDRFLEVVSPQEEGTTAGRLLERRSGDGGYMVIFQVDDLSAVAAHLEELGIRVVYVAHGDAITGLHIHPKDMPGAIVSIDEAEDPVSWPWAGTAWVGQEPSPTVSDIVGTTIQVEDPEAAASTWAAALRLEVNHDDVGSPILYVDDGYVRFVAVEDGRGPGVRGLDVAATDRGRAGETVTAVGAAINLV